jgi:hypothetical protein
MSRRGTFYFGYETLSLPAGPPSLNVLQEAPRTSTNSSMASSGLIGQQLPFNTHRSVAEWLRLWPHWTSKPMSSPRVPNGHLIEGVLGWGILLGAIDWLIRCPKLYFIFLRFWVALLRSTANEDWRRVKKLLEEDKYRAERPDVILWRTLQKVPIIRGVRTTKQTDPLGFKDVWIDRRHVQTSGVTGTSRW